MLLLGKSNFNKGTTYFAYLRYDRKSRHYMVCCRGIIGRLFSYLSAPFRQAAEPAEEENQGEEGAEVIHPLTLQIIVGERNLTLKL